MSCWILVHIVFDYYSRKNSKKLTNDVSEDKVDQYFARDEVESSLYLLYV